MNSGPKTYKKGNVVLIELSGRLTLGGPTSEQLRTVIRGFLDDGERKFILNLEEVTDTDSAGLGELISSYTSILKKDGDIKFLNLNEKLKDRLEMTKLLTVFDAYENQAAAVAALGG